MKFVPIHFLETLCGHQERCQWVPSCLWTPWLGSLIYMKALGDSIRNLGCSNTNMCTIPSPTFPPNSKEAVFLDGCLESVMGWMTLNKLNLNPDRSEDRSSRVSRKAEIFLRSPLSWVGLHSPWKARFLV